MPASLTRRPAPARVARAAAAPAAADEGIVVALAAITAHEDSVKDIITPGSFTDTLRRRRPKLCWMHDWKIPLGRVLNVVELRPGDKRLPKTLPDGRPFPASAGALLATVQFNLRTTAGRDFFEHAKEWAKNGEIAFSIGYKVHDGMATKRADGVRVIYALELFEVSLVLHGAHNMALGLEVKSHPLDGTGIYGDGFEVKSTGGLLEMKASPDFSGHAMVAVYPDDAAAQHVSHEDGLPVDDMHVTLAYLGKADEVADPEALARTLSAHTSQVGPLSGTVGGLGMFPAGDDGTPVWCPVDVNGLDHLRTAVVNGLGEAGQSFRGEHGFTPHMTMGYDLPSVEPVAQHPVSFDQAYLVVGGTRYPLPLSAPAMEAKSAVHDARVDWARTENKAGLLAVLEAKSGIPGVADTPSDLAAVQRLRESWSHGTMAARIGWGSDGDFDTCVALASEHMSPEEAKGWCNLRHHDALGFYPATHAKLARDAAGGVETKSATTAAPTGTETKAMAYMRGSQEERRDALDRALTDLLLPKKTDSDDDRYCTPSDCWTSVQATFDDYVIVQVTKHDGGRQDDCFKVPYSFGLDGGVALGKPEPVELSVVAVPDSDDGPGEELEEGEAVTARFINPAAARLTDLARLVGAVPEGKALDDLTAPLVALLDQLAVKGFNVAGAVLGSDDDEEDDGWGEDDPDGDADDAAAEDRVETDPEAGEDDPTDPMDEPNPADSLADGTVTPPEGTPVDDDLAEEGEDPAAVDDDEDGDEEVDPDGRVRLDPDAVKRQLADLHA